MTHSGRIRVQILDDGEDTAEMACNVRAGLLSTPKDLSPWPKYLYDATGSRLFEEITALPEYYQTRAELSILREAAPEIVALAQPRELAELGSGSASKTRTLLNAMTESSSNGQEAPVYAPLDVSESTLKESARRLVEEYPSLEVRGFVGDFERSLGLFLERPTAGRRLVVFLGGTIGNFTPTRRHSFLAEVRAGLREGDSLLLGVNLVKDPQTLEAAYHDGAGATARFNKNLLKVLNTRLGGNFDPELFRHHATYDPEARRVEMWLLSEREQQVTLRGLGLEVPFAAEEGLRTEISAKFTRGEVDRLLADADLELLDWRTDPRSLFGLALAGPRG